MKPLIDPGSIEARRLRKHLQERVSKHMDHLAAVDDATVSAKLRGAIAEARELLRELEPPAADPE